MPLTPEQQAERDKRIADRKEKQEAAKKEAETIAANFTEYFPNLRKFVELTVARDTSLTSSLDSQAGAQPEVAPLFLNASDQIKAILNGASTINAATEARHQLQTIQAQLQNYNQLRTVLGKFKTNGEKLDALDTLAFDTLIRDPNFKKELINFGMAGGQQRETANGAIRELNKVAEKLGISQFVIKNTEPNVDVSILTPLTPQQIATALEAGKVAQLG